MNKNNPINKILEDILRQAKPRPWLPSIPEISEEGREVPPGSTFTLEEMREAFEKHLNGEELTPKEKRLARAKACAIRATMY